MMISMVRFLAPALLAGFLLTVSPARAQGPNPELSSVQIVYVLPMGSGMDQFVAHQIARNSLFQVTTDPRQADAFISDFVGTTFETRVDDLLKAARDKAERDAEELAKKEAALEAAKNPKPKDSAKDKSKKEEDADSGEFHMTGDSARVHSFSRGRGNIFLVDAKSRRVLWTGFDVPKNTRPGELQKSAERLVSHLRKEKTGK
ncbi:MAG: hypothetical protein ABI972_02050 [Acidobacteriota bacterium]